MTDRGKCTSTENKCASDSFCPAIDNTEVECLSCSSSIKPGQGCNCVTDIQILNCKTCKNNTCSACIDGFTLFNNTCLPACTSSTDCKTDQTFCDKDQKLCVACSPGCITCKSASICSKCATGTFANIFGICEKNCSSVGIDAKGKYCANGSIIECTESLTSQCKCANSKNCASCTADFTKCASCLPGFKKVGDLCQQCAEGYQTFNNLCLKKSTSCEPGQYLNDEICEPCSKNCSTCYSFHKCDSCPPKFVLENNICNNCPSNCALCSSSAACTTCDPKFQLISNKCTPSCDNYSDCSDKQFCDFKSKTCKSCKLDNCFTCYSDTFCMKCGTGKFPNIHGTCTYGCGGDIYGKYCDDGDLKACGEGMTRECHCRAGKNCASCTDGNATCASCMEGFVLTNDTCDQCAEGFQKVDRFCFPVKIEGGDGDDIIIDGGDENSSGKKLSGGAIAGIIIGVLAVVGAGCAGLGYYFVKKSKAGREQVGENSGDVNVENEGQVEIGAAEQ